MSIRFQVEHHDRVGSTNDLAREHALAGAPEGLVVQADQQEAGRGRRGRAWASPQGNLYCSLLLRPDCVPAVAATLSFATVIALGDVLTDLLPDSTIQHKWPNDLLIGGKKVSGILLEAGGAAGNKLEWLVIGLGVNIVSHPDQALYPVTDLRAEGLADIPPADLLTLFLERFALHYAAWKEGGFSALLPAWKSRAVGLGRNIQVRLENHVLEGCFIDLDADGTLMLKLPEGNVRRVTAGDVFLATSSAD
ncbi:biotin--[acetyl-CoA-carboxylase] ligase [Dongia soli]|uniref:biotin--[biotin carboxyl-carrier protein] ligase n=1 Tax=Dongia soli TaxID=600628 RepID=A0ABU5EAJ9_9PROT|nr:biotin--[acetyl-CoA-carboxylase] ligase [Dongia soli]MDY0883020.1 biotin--[acetyl-CoA-carboxylase] ligase [Dongia soli]